MQKNELLATEEVQGCAVLLGDKVSYYFQEELKKTLRLYAPKRANHQQVMDIITYSLSAINAELISIFSMTIKDSTAILTMLSTVSQLSEKMTMDIYQSNKLIYEKSDLK